MAKLALNNLEPEITREVTLKLLHSVDPLKNRDTKDRGTLHLKVSVVFIYSFTSLTLTYLFRASSKLKDPTGSVNKKCIQLSIS